MWRKFCLTLAVAVVVGGTLLEVVGQRTVDDRATTSSALYEVEKLIRNGFRDVQDILGSNQQQCPPQADADSRSRVNDSLSYTLNEAVNLIRDGFKDVKDILGSNQQQYPPDSRSCVNDSLSSVLDAVKLIKDGLSDVKLIKEDVKHLRGVSDRDEQQSRPLDTSGLTVYCFPLLIQQNVNGSDFFNRSWEEYKLGFHDTRGNFWLGNDLLHELTKDGRYRLRFDLQERLNASWYWAEYSRFFVGNETSNYTLQVSGYSGNTGRDALDYHDGMMFSSYDRDNDRWSDVNCAARNGGGFWYHSCALADVNGVPGGYDDFRWYNKLLKSTRMWLMCT